MVPFLMLAGHIIIIIPGSRLWIQYTVFRLFSQQLPLWESCWSFQKWSFSQHFVCPQTHLSSDLILYVHTCTHNYYEAQFVNHVLQLTKRVSALSSTVGDTSCQVYAIIEMMVNTGSTCSAELMTYQAWIVLLSTHCLSNTSTIRLVLVNSVWMFARGRVLVDNKF